MWQGLLGRARGYRLSNLRRAGARLAGARWGAFILCAGIKFLKRIKICNLPCV